MPKDTRSIRMNDLDLRLIRVFCQVVESQGFAAAEVHLNKSKAAISMDISGLEARLGRRLCNRGPAGFSLTQAGYEVYELSQRLLADIGHYREAVSRVVGNPGGEYTVAVDDDFFESMDETLPAAFSNFRLRFPNVFLNLLSLSSADVLKAVCEGSADFGINDPSLPLKEVHETHLFDEVIDLFCGAGHELAKQPDRAVTEAAIEQQMFIEMRNRSDPGTTAFMRRMKIGARAQTMNARLCLLRSGQFLGYLPVMYAKRWVARRVVRPIGQKRYQFSSRCVALTQRRNRNDPRALALSRFVAEAIAQHRSHDNG